MIRAIYIYGRFDYEVMGLRVVVVCFRKAQGRAACSDESTSDCPRAMTPESCRVQATLSSFLTFQGFPMGP